MKKFIILSFLGAAMLASCQDDNTMFSEPIPVRAYETDVQIMSQFIEVDNATGLYVLNPDKKILATDYLINRSSEELMKVSQTNKNRFLEEMATVNSQIQVMRRSGLIDAYIYTTSATDNVIMGKEDASIIIKNLTQYSYSHSDLATLTLEGGQNMKASFYSASDITMKLNLTTGYSFFLSQLILGDQENEDAKIIIISGVKPRVPHHAYRIKTPSNLGDYKTLSGKTLIGSGNITVSVSQ